MFVIACQTKDKEKEKNPLLIPSQQPPPQLTQIRLIKDSISRRDETPRFTVSFKELCKDDHGMFMDLKKYKRYGKHCPYAIDEKTNDDSLQISFDFIDDCCLRYAGAIQLSNDTLWLYYYKANDSSDPCDCYCDYRMIYRTSVVTKNWKALKIIHGEFTKNRR